VSTDLCAAALLKDLAVLDRPPLDFTQAERRALLASARESVTWLTAAGGGPFELETLARIGTALDAAMGAS
jgi:hypothetical protein